MSLQDCLKSVQNAISTRPNQVTLTQVIEIANFQDTEIEQLLQDWYSSDDAIVRLFATLFNSIFTQRRYAFFLSKSIFADLVKKDPNTKRKTVDSKTYKQLMIQVLNIGLFKELRAATRSQARVLAVKDQAISDTISRLLGSDVQQVQVEQAVEMYDEMSESENIQVEQALEMYDEIIGSKHRETVHENDRNTPSVDPVAKPHTTLPPESENQSLSPSEEEVVQLVCKSCKHLKINDFMMLDPDNPKRKKRVGIIHQLLTDLKTASLPTDNAELIADAINNLVIEPKNKSKSAAVETLKQEIRDTVLIQACVLPRWKDSQ